MRYRVYQDARFANGAVAAGRTLTVYEDEGMATEATLYTTATGSAGESNPYTVPSTGVIDFWATTPRPWGLAQGDATARPLRVLGSEHVVSVLDYGAVGDGTTDDLAAVQGAVDACPSGGTVLFPPGSYLVSTDVHMPVNLTGRLTLSGYGATIITGSTGRGFLDFVKVDDHDCFQHYIIEGFDIDASSIGSARSVIGNRQLSKANIRFHDITIRDIYCYGGPTDNESYYAMFIWMTTAQDGTGEATQDYITNVTLDNVRLDGGDCLAMIGGEANADTGTTLCNIWMDNIMLRDCHHERGVAVGYHTNSYQIGGRAFGGTCTFENCSSHAGDDCCFEVNGFAEATFINCTADDGLSCGFYMPNFTERVDSSSQVITFRNCTVRHTTHGDTGWKIQNASGGSNIGTVVLDGCRYENTSGTLTGRSAIYTSAGTFGKLVLRDFGYVATGWTQAGATAKEMNRLYHTNGVVEIDGCSIYLEGTSTTSGALGLRWLVDYGTSATTRLSVRRLTYSSDVTKNDGTTVEHQVFFIGYGNGNTFSGTFDECVWGASTDDGAPTFLYLYTDVTPGQVLFRNCDWRTMTADTSRFYVHASIVNGKNVIRERDCLYATTPAPASITTKVTLTVDEITAATAAVVRTTAAHGLTSGDWVFLAASNSTPVVDGWRQVTVTDTTHFSVPVTTSGSGDSATCQPAYTNRDYYDEDVVVSGGTVSTIQLSTNAGTTWTTTGLTAGMFRLRCGDSICVTNSSAPTTTKIPRP